MSQKKIIIFLSLILIIAGFLRLNQLHKIPPGLFSDEAVNGNNASEAMFKNDYKIFYPENNGREGLFMNIQSLSTRTFGNHPWSLRLPSAIFGILTVLGMYFLGKELFFKEVGLAASFLIATGFWHIIFSRIGFRAIMSPFFIVWSLYFFIHALRLINLSRKKAVVFGAIAGITYGLGFYSYIAYRITPLLFIGIIAYFLFVSENKKWVLYVSSIFIALSIIVFAPLGLYFLNNPQDFMGRTSQISIFNSGHAIRDLSINTLKTLGMFNILGDGNWRHNFAGRPQLFWPVGIMFIVGIIHSLRQVIIQKSFSHATLLGLFILAFGPVVISNEGLPHALRAMLMIPSVFLFAGLGMVWIYEYSKKYIHLPWRNILFALLAILIVSDAYYSYFIAWAKRPEVRSSFNYDFTELGYKLKNLPKEPAKYVILEDHQRMGAETIMFISDTYLPEQQKEKNIFYLQKNKEGEVPPNSLKFYIK